MHFASRFLRPAISSRLTKIRGGLLSLLVLTLCSLPVSETVAQTGTGTPAQSEAATPGGPVRLRQANGPSMPASTSATSSAPQGPREMAEEASAPVNDFETYVNAAASTSSGKAETLKRFGNGLWTRTDGDSQDGSPLVPGDYVLQAGDEINVSVWGAVDADLRLQIDRSGRVNVPRVGAVTLMGVRYADLATVLTRKFDQVFKNYQLAASLSRLRGVRVYVTGFVARPGAYTVSSLSSVANALAQAGGPSVAGSMRDVRLRRGREPVASIDLYDLLLKGDRVSDRLVQPEDVIHVGPIGTQVAIIGNVNRPAIFELKPGETVADLLQMSGGFSTVGDRTRLTIERLADRNAGRVVELPMPASEKVKLDSGDIVRAFSMVDAVLPSQQKNKLVLVDGEVQRPGEYLLPPNSTVNDALRMAGGLTAAAHVYATEFTRRSVLNTQRANYERVVRDLEAQLTRATHTQRAGTQDDAQALAVNRASADRFIASLRRVQPTGRVVLELAPTSLDLPDLTLEDGDRLYVPPKQSTVSVFGSVFNAGSYLFREGRQIGEYLGLAGGPSKDADTSSIIVLRANGTVTSAVQQSGLFRAGKLDNIAAQAGDTIFVPEEFNKESSRILLRDWTAILYNFGIGAAAIKAVFN